MINKAIIVGNVGKDPEVRYSTSGVAVCNLSVATSRKWKDKSGDKQEETEWHRVVLYDKTAEIAGEFVKKGSQVYIEGRLKTRKWTDKDGAEKYTTEIVADVMQLIGKRPDADEQRDTRTHAEMRQAPRARDDAARARQTRAPVDDDVPF